MLAHLSTCYTNHTTVFFLSLVPCPRNNICASLTQCESEELDQCLALWRRLKDEPRWEADWVLKALAASQRTALSLSAHCDGIYNVVQVGLCLFVLVRVCMFCSVQMTTQWHLPAINLHMQLHVMLCIPRLVLVTNSSTSCTYISPTAGCGDV